jgi:hypothetical protein
VDQIAMELALTSKTIRNLLATARARLITIFRDSKRGE